MKREYTDKPETFQYPWPGAEDLFPWQDFLAAIPLPIFVITTYKANGKPNACLQAWSTFFGVEGQFLCIMGAVNKQGHLYQSLMQTRECVLNFPSADIFDKCRDTVDRNDYDIDEIDASGLTAEPARTVNAPRIAECFLNLECEFLWEKESISPADTITVCVRVRHVAMDPEHSDESRKGRYGPTGYVFNIHGPLNPETGKQDGSWVGEMRKVRKFGEA